MNIDRTQTGDPVEVSKTFTPKLGRVYPTTNYPQWEITYPKNDETKSLIKVIKELTKELRKIRKVNTAPPYTWISVKHKMPGTGLCLICGEYGIEKARWTGDYWDAEPHERNESEVWAWMPLPKPYRRHKE